MPDPVRRVVSGPAGDLAVWEHAGRAPATLLLHGIGNYGRVWDDLARAVAGRLRLVAPDARGHGDSAAPPNGYAPEDFVADAIAVLDALGLERVPLVGHSMGGGHAFALALAHPERCAGLALIDIGPDLEPEGRERSLRLSRDRPASFPDRGAAEAYLRATSPGYSDRVYADRVRWLFRHDGDALVWRSSAAALRQIFATPARPGTWEALARLPMPLLVVRGSRSSHLARTTAERMVRTAPRARLVELDAGHNVQLDRPEALAAAIVDFAREVGG